MDPTPEQIRLAGDRIGRVLSPTPIIRSNALSRMIGAEVFLKLENLQETGSFKVRGAYNRLVQLGDEERKRGVIAASAGNHAQGVAWASDILGIKATIVMPEQVSIKKLLAVQEYGTSIVLSGSLYDDAYTYAVNRAQEEGTLLIPAFDDPSVIAGQGTIGMELMDVLTEDTAVLVPVGGGGLISGVAIWLKAQKPKVRIIGVEADACPSAIASLRENRPVKVDATPTLADGIAVKRPGELTFHHMQHLVDDMVSVGEESIAGAIMNLLEKVNIIAEGSGAAPLAALMDVSHGIRAKHYVLIISGGNIEVNTIDRIIQKGSVKMGRLIRVQVDLDDIPGSLWTLLGMIAEEKANILHIFHDRLAPENPVTVSRVKLNLETRGPDHATHILERLREAGYDVTRLL